MKILPKERRKNNSKNFRHSFNWDFSAPKVLIHPDFLCDFPLFKTEKNAIKKADFYEVIPGRKLNKENKHKKNSN